MTTDAARRWLILASLVITGVQIIFLIVAPVFGLPLEYPKNLNLLQITSPVFVGYLGSAVHFIFMTPPPEIPARIQFLGLLVKGPIIIYACAIISAFAAFAFSNRAGAPIGGGMSVDNLATAISIALGLLAATTGAIIAFLFAANQGATNATPPQEVAQKPAGG
jgi:hypothetical protein